MRTLCNHYFCSQCLSQAFQCKQTDYIMCPECQSIVHFTVIKVAEERFQQQLAYLDVQCIKCQKVGPLCTFTLHFCQSDLPHEFPSQCSLDLVTSTPKKEASTSAISRSKTDMEIQTSPILAQNVTHSDGNLSATLQR